MSHAVLMRKSEAAPAAKTAAPSKIGANGLRIGRPDDGFEREADRVADAVMAGDKAGAEWSFSRMNVDALLQRKCSCGAAAPAGGKCESCKEKESLQRKAAGPAENTGAPPIVHEVLNSPGKPLDDASRHFFERRFARHVVRRP